MQTTPSPSAAPDPALASEPALEPRERIDRPPPGVRFKPPVVQWLGERQIVTLSVAVAILVPTICLYWTVSAINQSRSTLWVAQPDDSGAYTVAPAEMDRPESKLFVEVAMQAADLALRRNSRGLSSPEFAERMFIGMAKDDLMSHVQATSADRRRRNLFDAPEITTVELFDRSSREKAYVVTGTIVRSGTIDEQPLREVGQFRMFLKLVPQPAFQDKGRYPFAIQQWAVKITWDDKSKENWGNGMREARR